MARNKTTKGLATGGQSLWDAITAEHDLDPVQQVQLLEACRMKDRLDELDSIIQGKGVLNLMQLRVGEVFDPERVTVTVKFDAVLAQANSTANTMKQLLAALRLPDEVTGKRPQQRGGARGAYRAQTSTAAAKAASRWGA